MSFGKLGALGKGFGRLGGGSKAGTGGSPPPAPGVGEPMGLLLVLTYPS